MTSAENTMAWHKICSLSDLCIGQIEEFSVGGVKVVVVRGEEGVLVIPPMCPHLEEPLREGMCDGKTLTCHKHLWQWDIKTCAPIGEARKPLQFYKSRVENNSVYAMIDEEILYDYD